MFDLKCKRKGCEFNKDCNCTAKAIEIKDDTGCKTYKPADEIIHKQDEKIGQPPIRKNIEAHCDANCLFNKEHHCVANGITVQTCDNVSQPNCCTFQPK